MNEFNGINPVLDTNNVQAFPTQSKLFYDGRKTQGIVRRELLELPVPPCTDTFQPIPHHKLVESLEESLAYRHIRIIKEEFAISNDGMKLFGLLELNATFEDVRFSIGIRNSNDKSMRLGMVAGYRVQVCSNMMFSGEFNPLLAKHTKGFALDESVSIGVDRIQRGFQPLKESIQQKRATEIADDDARLLIYQAFMAEKFPITLIKTVHQNYFEPPHQEFQTRTFWSLENAFTESFKELQPLRQFEVTAKLGKFLNTALSAPKSETTSAEIHQIADYRKETFEDRDIEDFFPSDIPFPAQVSNWR
jgi:hypothetical protein